MSSEPCKTVLICGCARSGNTLMLHFCAASFQNVAIVCDEQEPTPIVGKAAVFGKWPRAINHDEVLRKHHIIYMMRDPRDVICSRHGKAPDKQWTGPVRWMKAARKYWELFKDSDRKHGLNLVRYEDLIQRPSAVQLVLAESLQLVESHEPFSPEWEARRREVYELDSGDNKKAVGALRPPDASRIGAWRQDYEDVQRVGRAMLRYRDLSPLMESFGYDHAH